MASCGGAGPAAPDSAGPPQPAATARPATAVERSTLTRLERRIQLHCTRVARSLADPSARPTPAQERRAFAAADAMLDLATRSPTADLGAGQDLRLFIADVVENLEGSNCDPRLRGHLARGLRRIPRG